MSNETKHTSVGSLMVDVDTSELTVALALAEKVTAAAKEAGAAIAALGAASLGECVVCELAHDETPGLILAELRGLRADLQKHYQTADAIGLPLRVRE